MNVLEMIVVIGMQMLPLFLSKKILEIDIATAKKCPVIQDRNNDFQDKMHFPLDVELIVLEIVVIQSINFE